MINLTSLERLSRVLCVELTPKNKAKLSGLLYAVSANIQAYINNDLELSQKEEFFDIHSKEREFWVGSLPIVSISEVAYDFQSDFSGGESIVNDYTTGKHERSVLLEFTEIPGKKVLKVTYIGGKSTEATLSTYAISGISGSFIVNKFVTGAISGAVGIVKAFSTTSMQVDVLYGVFKASETLSMQNTEGGADIGGIIATLDSKTVESLVETNPDISTACELQIGYNFRLHDSFEVTNIEKDKTVRRDTQKDLTYNGTYNDLQPEVRSLLNKYRRVWIA